MPAADRLLADEHAVSYPSAWLAAAWRSRAGCTSRLGDRTLSSRTAARVGEVAGRVGDEYYLALGRLRPG